MMPLERKLALTRTVSFAINFSVDYDTPYRNLNRRPRDQVPRKVLETHGNQFRTRKVALWATNQS